MRRQRRRMAARRYAVVTGGILGVALVAYLYWLWVRRWRLRSMAISAFTSLNETGIPYWVDFGTLLGIHREGDIILGDNDVDVCVLEPSEEDMRRLGEHVNQRGYDFRYLVWSSISRIYDRWWPFAFVDLYHVRMSVDGTTYHGATGATSDVPVDLIGRPVKRWWQRGNVNVTVPENVPGVLVWRYGEGWQTPRPGFKGRNA